MLRADNECTLMGPRGPSMMLDAVRGLYRVLEKGSQVSIQCS